MILKIVYYEKEAEQNPNRECVTVMEVSDFHIDKPKDSTEKCSHELTYHALNGEVGTCLVGSDKQNADHVYVMDGGKTVDHMRFYAR